MHVLPWRCYSSLEQLLLLLAVIVTVVATRLEGALWVHRGSGCARVLPASKTWLLPTWLPVATLSIESHETLALAHKTRETGLIFSSLFIKIKKKNKEKCKESPLGFLSDRMLSKWILAWTFGRDISDGHSVVEAKDSPVFCATSFVDGTGTPVEESTPQGFQWLPLCTQLTRCQAWC